MRIKTTVNLLFVLIMMSVSVAITTAQDETNCDLGVVMPSLNRLYYVNIFDAITQAAEASGYSACSASAENDIEQEMAAVQGFVESGVQALLILPLDLADSAEAINLAAGADIPVFLLGDNVTGAEEAVAGVIGATPEAIGESAGEYFCESVEAGSTVIVMIGRESAMEAEDSEDEMAEGSEEEADPMMVQAESLRDYMAENCEDVIVAMQESTDFSIDASLEFLAETLSDEPTIGGIFTTDDALADAVSFELDEPENSNLISSDLSTITLEMLDQRWAAGIIAIDPESYGQVAVSTVIAQLTESEVEEGLAPELVIVTQENSSTFRSGDGDCLIPGDC